MCVAQPVLFEIGSACIQPLLDLRRVPRQQAVVFAAVIPDHDGTHADVTVGSKVGGCPIRGWKLRGEGGGSILSVWRRGLDRNHA